LLQSTIEEDETGICVFLTKINGRKFSLVGVLGFLPARGAIS